MWHLKMAERGGAWVTVSSFESVATAAEKIIGLEGYPVSGVFFEILIETGSPEPQAKKTLSATLNTHQHEPARIGKVRGHLQLNAKWTICETRR
jgi:hypothetical protein